MQKYETTCMAMLFKGAHAAGIPFCIPVSLSSADIKMMAARTNLLVKSNPTESMCRAGQKTPCGVIIAAVRKQRLPL